MDEIKLMKRFLASFKMGSEMIKNIEKNSKSLEYRKMWIDILNSFIEHEKSLTTVMEKLGVDTNVNLSCMQKMAICMQNMKLKGNDDFELMQFGIEGMEMGMVGIFKFLYVNSKFDRHFVSEVISIYEEYEKVFHQLVKRAKNVLDFDSKRIKVEIDEI